jgi:transcriptional regulator with XRE-family HTH domain
LADLLGLDRRTISRWESGRNHIPKFMDLWTFLDLPRLLEHIKKK